MDAAYGKCGFIDVISADAGLCSLKNADIVDGRNATYVFGLKGNQESLYQAAQVILIDKANQSAPEAQTPWETRAGGRIQRQLFTTTELQNFEISVGVWTHITQVWLVRQITERPDKGIVIEDRYFVTNIAPGRLTPHEKLTLVRAHWRIENDAFNSLDMQWNEDSTPWCTLGAALWSLSILRCIAYNLIQYLRRCHLPEKTSTPTQTAVPTWSEVFEAVRMTVQSARILADYAISETSSRLQLKASHTICETS